MPAKRVRVREDGGPAPCVVRVPKELAAYLYREVRARGYTDETELVAAIVREWVKDQKKVDWPKLRAELLADEGKATKDDE